MAHMNQYVLDYEPKTYAGAGGKECKVDCSLGVNMDPLPKRVVDKFRNLSEDHLKHYPHDEDVFDWVLKKLSAASPGLVKENLAMGCGSIDVLLNIDGLFLNTHKSAVGYAPQFSAYVDDIHLKGAKYIGVPLRKEDNYKIDIKRICEAIIENKPDLVYIDNPNNPTGQILSKMELLTLCSAANSVDAVIIVDEAYGDYMPLEYSMVSYVPDFDHLIVTKTMSKGYGMAGMRMGYAVGPAKIIKQLNKMLVPFNCNSLARDLAIAMLTDDNYLVDLGERTGRKVKRILNTLTGKIKVAETALNVPVSLLYTEDETIDLTDLLADVGISAVSGASFDNLGINSVRLMVPTEGEMDLLCQLLSEAEKRIKG